MMEDRWIIIGEVEVDHGALIIGDPIFMKPGDVSEMYMEAQDTIRKAIPAGSIFDGKMVALAPGHETMGKYKVMARLVTDPGNHEEIIKEISIKFN